MTLAIDSKKAKEIEQFITASTIAKPTPALKYNNFQWKYKGKELKDVYNTIGEEKYSCDTIFLVDIDLLRYNFQNRRIQIYLKELAELKKTNRAEFKSQLYRKPTKRTDFGLRTCYLASGISWGSNQMPLASNRS